MTKSLIALLCLLPSSVVMLWLSGVMVLRMGRKRGWWK